MTYMQYIPQYCRKERNNAYQLKRNNIHQPYNERTQCPSITTKDQLMLLWETMAAQCKYLRNISAN